MSVRHLISLRMREAARLRRQPDSPAELARMLDPGFVVTPTIRLLSDIAVRQVTEPDQRDIVNTPPRTGKSRLLVIWTVVWTLMVDPDREIVIVSYSDELAQTHSREARKIIREHSRFLGYELAQDKTAVGRWRVEGYRGGLLATGINSGVTGFGADCVAPDTRITTERGNVTAERAFAEQHAFIWAFDHTSGMARWCPVEASRRIDGRDVVTVWTVGGRVLRCTPDHRIYTRRGYLPAGELTVADEILAFSCPGGVRPVWRGVPDDGVRTTESCVAEDGRALLLGVVPFSGVRRPEAVAVLSGVRRADSDFTEVDLLESVLVSASGGQAPGDLVRSVRPGVSARVQPEGVLQPRVCGRGALLADDRQGQFESQDWDELRELVSSDAADDLGARRAPVRGVWTVPTSVDVLESREVRHEVAAGDPSHQRAAVGQPAAESDHDVRVVPHHPSQVEFDAVSAVERDSGGQVSVYDFQVAGTSNFFADDLLVHNCLIIDDPIKDQTEADSTAHRKRVLNEYRSTLATRVHPGGSICLVQTRWHELDLAGALLKQEPDVWRHTNIPAISDPKVPDALQREIPGVAMVSALGFTPAHYAALRRTSGERPWYALYMGSPSTPTGGLVKTAWLERWRLDAAPRNPVFTMVAVDPSDSGDGDSCGLIAVSLTSTRVVALIADKSRPMTSDEWARAAVRLAVTVGASQIVVEGFTARATYVRVVREALDAESVGRPIGVSAWPPKGHTRVGDAVARSAALLQALEVGKCVLAGHHPEFERKATAWQAGQHQPDSLAALVIGHDVAVRAAGQEWSITSPADLVAAAQGGRPAPVVDMNDWMHRKLA